MKKDEATAMFLTDILDKAEKMDLDEEKEMVVQKRSPKKSKLSGHEFARIPQRPPTPNNQMERPITPDLSSLSIDAEAKKKA